jgi:hypothetical protein
MKMNPFFGDSYADRIISIDCLPRFAEAYMNVCMNVYAIMHVRVCVFVSSRAPVHTKGAAAQRHNKATEPGNRCVTLIVIYNSSYREATSTIMHYKYPDAIFIYVRQ